MFREKHLQEIDSVYVLFSIMYGNADSVRNFVLLVQMQNSRDNHISRNHLHLLE